MGKFIASDPEYSHYVASLFLSLSHSDKLISQVYD